MPATLLGQPHACNPTGAQAGPCLHMVSWLAFPMKNTAMASHRDSLSHAARYC